MLNTEIKQMEKMRGLTKPFLITMVHSSVVSQIINLLERVEPQRPNLLRVLTYHQIDVPEAFEEQMRYLAENYHVISADELLAAYKGDRILPARSVMITFDDAYRNFAECAWPALKRYQLPVTLFVPTAFPDQPERLFWWDRLQNALSCTFRRDVLDTPAGKFSLSTAASREHALKCLINYVKSLPHDKALTWTNCVCNLLEVSDPEHSVLSWNELRQLAREGVTLGAHTRTHPLMTRIAPEEACAEAVGSLHDLEQEVGQVLPIFAYPDGRYSDEVVKRLKQAGFAIAFTTVRGTNDLNQADWLRLRRINIGQRATLPVLRARLLHSSAYLDRLRPVSGAH